MDVNPLPVLGSFDAAQPFAVCQIPVDGPAHARLERFLRRPAELAPDLRCVDRIATVVSRPVGYVRDEPLATGTGLALVDEAAQRAHDVDVRHLRAAAHVVRLARTTAVEH